MGTGSIITASGRKDFLIQSDRLKTEKKVSGVRNEDLLKREIKGRMAAASETGNRRLGCRSNLRDESLQFPGEGVSR